MLGLKLGEIDGLLLGDILGDTEELGLTLGETEAEKDGEIEGLKLGERDILGEVDGLTLGETDGLKDGLILKEGLTLGEIELISSL